jgi:hypothetical protein
VNGSWSYEKFPIALLRRPSRGLSSLPPLYKRDMLQWVLRFSHSATLRARLVRDGGVPFIASISVPF